MRRPRLDWASVPIHPLLAAAYPVVFLFAANADEQVTLQPLWTPLLYAVGGTAVVLATDGQDIQLAAGRKLKVSITNPLTIRTK